MRGKIRSDGTEIDCKINKVHNYDMQFVGHVCFVCFFYGSVLCLDFLGLVCKERQRQVI